MNEPLLNDTSLVEDIILYCYFIVIQSKNQEAQAENCWRDISNLEFVGEIFLTWSLLQFAIPIVLMIEFLA